MDSNILLLAGMGLMIFLLMRNISRRNKKGRPKSIDRQLKESDQYFKARDARTKDKLIDAPAQVGRWQVEMHETARDLKAELDSKILVLQSVIKTARVEIDRLEKTIDSARQV